MPGYVKVFGLGTLKFSLDLVILTYRAACLASPLWYIDHPMWGLEDGKRPYASSYFGSFCLLICDESGCAFVMLRALDVNNSRS